MEIRLPNDGSEIVHKLMNGPVLNTGAQEFDRVRVHMIIINGLNSGVFLTTFSRFLHLKSEVDS